ncbi:hypothetical protein DP145_04915 [Clostridium tetani]|uniref:hypothetical protein n=1 Tax=Clostridium tetani TaxID=1513 RepID=UPI00100BBB6E|nr:hypothetical protein [Clostridium tetani]RXI46894.1 hypothetical protein DP126_04250 [Clostridium tetani]RXM60798.1 hypothetical protein DP138_06670 [Clostridium tetani]RXM68528.1 hypothetical protein DP145_04915 [Clostridium tetani]
MAKYIKCIFNSEKDCDDCNKCDICDLNPSKICDSCGKCLENDIEKDMRSLEIEEVIEDEEKNIDWFKESSLNSLPNEEEGEDEYPYEFIEDIEGLSEILENQEKSEKFTYEEFPGLIKIKKME